MKQHPYTHLLQTNSSQSIFPSQNQRTSDSNFVALDWYTNLLISYKQQWNSFVQLFKKQFSSQKTAYYAQVCISLTKNDNETVRHFALRVQKLGKKGWCNKQNIN